MNKEELRQTVKNCALTFFKTVGLFAQAQYKNRNRLRILSYHGVGDDLPPALNVDGFMVPEEVFEQQLRVLRDQHYHVMPLVKAVKMLIDEELPEHAVAITFDDGYANNYDVASVLLARYDFPATFFATTGYLDGSDYPWWFPLRAKMAEQARERGMPLDWQTDVVDKEQALKDSPRADRMQALQDLEITSAWQEGLPKMMTFDDVEVLARQGFDIGGHTVHHISFGHETDEVVKSEVCDSLQALRDASIKPSRCYAYPYGSRSNVRIDENFFKEQGLDCFVTDEPGLNSCLTHPYLLSRIGITGNHDALAFEAVVSGFKQYR